MTNGFFLLLQKNICAAQNHLCTLVNRVFWVIFVFPELSLPGIIKIKTRELRLRTHCRQEALFTKSFIFTKSLILTLKQEVTLLLVFFETPNEIFIRGRYNNQWNSFKAYRVCTYVPVLFYIIEMHQCCMNYELIEKLFVMLKGILAM